MGAGQVGGVTSTQHWNTSWPAWQLPLAHSATYLSACRRTGFLAGGHMKSTTLWTNQDSIVGVCRATAYTVHKIRDTYATACYWCDCIRFLLHASRICLPGLCNITVYKLLTVALPARACHHDTVLINALTYKGAVVFATPTCCYSTTTNSWIGASNPMACVTWQAACSCMCG